MGLQPVPGSVAYSSLTCSKKVKQVDFIQTVHHKKGIKRNCASEHTKVSHCVVVDYGDDMIWVTLHLARKRAAKGPEK